MENSTFTYMGIKVVESPFVLPVPKIQMSPHFRWCSEEFRARHNAWLLARFGTKDQMLVMTDPVSGRKTLFMNPKHAAILRVQSEQNR